jgi:signal transduction histidine kinase
MIKTSDAERLRIAAAVHDVAVQELIGVSFGLAAEAKTAPYPLGARIGQYAESTRHTIRSLRSLLSSVYPVTVPDGGWLEGIDDLVDLARAQRMTVTIDAEPLAMNPLQELLVLRVAREALRNAIDHSGASDVVIRCTRVNDSIHLEISDDGQGFTADVAQQRNRDGHLGLELMKDIASDSGGDVSVTSVPGTGTSILLELNA